VFVLITADLFFLASLSNGKSEWRLYVPGPGNPFVSLIPGLTEFPKDLPILDLYLDKK
jgi:hypothetical protein